MTIKLIDKRLKIVLNEKEMRQNPICLKILDGSPDKARAALLQIFKIACRRIGVYGDIGSLYVEVFPEPGGRCTIYYATEQKLKGGEMLFAFNSAGDMFDFVANLKQKKYSKLTAALYIGRQVYLHLNDSDTELLVIGNEYAKIISKRYEILSIIEQSRLEWAGIEISEITRYL